MLNQDAKILLDEIAKSQVKLSDWERRFIVSIGTQLNTPQRLSAKQMKVLQEIYRKSQGHELTERRKG